MCLKSIVQAEVTGVFSENMSYTWFGEEDREVILCKLSSRREVKINTCLEVSVSLPVLRVVSGHGILRVSIT